AALAGRDVARGAPPARPGAAAAPAVAQPARMAARRDLLPDEHDLLRRQLVAPGRVPGARLERGQGGGAARGRQHDAARLVARRALALRPARVAPPLPARRRVAAAPGARRNGALPRR